MSNEMETAGLASIGALSPGGKADLSGQPCRNCGEQVEQRHCPKCGQLAASFHRPFLSLIADSVTDSLALDGRIARTLPLLLFRPGVLTRRYKSGRRARYVPPFRLFLLSSLLFYFVGFSFLGQSNWLDVASVSYEGRELTSQQREELQGLILSAEGELDEAQVRELIRQVAEGDGGGAPETAADEVPPGEDSAPDDPAGPDGEDVLPEAVPGAGTMDERIDRITGNPRLFLSAVETWTPRLSLLLVPLTMLALALMYFWRRSIYVYDHAIHALHLHSWMYLAATAAIGLGWLAGAELATGIFLLAVPVYVLFSLRGAYRSGFFSSLLRTLLMGLVWLVSMSFLLVAVLLASAMEM